MGTGTGTESFTHQKPVPMAMGHGFCHQICSNSDSTFFLPRHVTFRSIHHHHHSVQPQVLVQQAACYTQGRMGWEKERKEKGVTCSKSPNRLQLLTMSTQVTVMMTTLLSSPQCTRVCTPLSSRSCTATTAAITMATSPPSPNQTRQRY